MAQPNQNNVSPIEPQASSSAEVELRSFYVRAQYDFTSPDASALAFVQGDIIEVLTQLPSGWWDGLLNGIRGWFPSNYVERISEEEVEALIVEMEAESEGQGVEILPNGQTRPISSEEVDSSARPTEEETTASTSRPQTSQDLGLAQGIEIDDDDADWLRREMERDVGFDDLARGIMESDDYGEEVDLGGQVQEESQKGQFTEGEPKASSSKDRSQEEEAEGDFWVPSMTPDGQIYYHNTKTGESSWELPGVDTSALGDTFDVQEDTYELAQSFASLEPTTASSLGEFKIPPKNVPEPWQARITDDGSEWYFVNRVTGERRAELPTEVDTRETLVQDVSRLSVQTDLSALNSAPGQDRSSLPSLSQATVEAERAKRRAIEAACQPSSELTVGSMVFAVDQALRDVFDAVGSGTEAEQALGNPRDRNTLTEPLIEQRDDALHQLRVAVGKTTSAICDLVTAIGYVTLPSSGTTTPEREDFPGLPPWIEDMIKAQWSVSAALSKLVFSVHTASLSATTPDHSLQGENDSWGDVLRAGGKLRDVATHFPVEASHIRAAKGDRGMLDAGNQATGRRKNAAFGVAGMGLYGTGNWGFGRAETGEEEHWVDLDETVASEVDNLKLQVDAALAAAEAAAPLERCVKIVDLMRVVSRFKRTVASIDMAASLDLDGEVSAYSAGPSSSGSSYSELVGKAQTAFLAFEQASQVLVDSTACLALALASTDPRAAREHYDLLAMVGVSTSDIVTGVRSLRRIAVDQDYAVSRGLAVGQIGARAQTNRSQTSSRRSSRRSSKRMTRPPSVISSVSRSSRFSKRSSLKARAVGLDEEFLDMDAKEQAQAAAEERDNFDHALMYKASSGSQSSLAGKGRSRSGSNATGSVAGSDGYGGGSVRSSSTAGLIKAMPFLRNRSNSDADETRTSPSKKNSGNSKKLAKLLGEDSAIPSRLPPRQPEETPFYLEPNYHPSEIVFDDKGGVKAGTLSALVERLTPHNSTDTNFFQAFLTTYRSFATGPEVIDLLVKRYLLEPPPGLTPEQLSIWQSRKQTPIRLRVINTLKVWLDQHFTETDDVDILHQIRDFSANVLPAHGNESSSKQLLNLVARRLSGEHATRKMVSGAMFAPPAPLIPRVPTGRSLRLLDINPIELARQLTILESGRYNRCRPGEFLDCAWSSPDGDTRSPNLKWSIFSSNRMAGWVTETILMHNDAKRRAATMKMWIQTATECRLLNNFSSMAACIAGVNAAPIERLKRTKELLSIKTVAMKAELDDKLDSSGNFAKYRQLLKTVNPPCVPFLGFYLTMLTFLGDGNADMIVPAAQPGDSDPPKPLINFYKRSLTADIIREIQQYQTQPYNLQPCAPILAFIEKSCEDVDKAPDLYELSLSLEPRERDDEKITRMLHESGFI